MGGDRLVGKDNYDEKHYQPSIKAELETQAVCELFEPVNGAFEHSGNSITVI